MQYLTKVLIGLSGLAFVLTVITAFFGEIMGISPEGFSRKCSNLALLAIAFKEPSRDT